jgi:hypothetical protein
LNGIIFEIGVGRTINNEPKFKRACIVLMYNNPTVIEAHHCCKDNGFNGLYAITETGELENLKYELYNVYANIQGSNYGPPNFSINGQRSGSQWLQFDTLSPIHPAAYPKSGSGDCLKIFLPPANDNATTSSDCSLAETFSICEFVN